MTDVGVQTARTSNLGANLNTTPNYDIQTPAQWAQAQLDSMGLPATQNNIDFLVSWAAREGGNWGNTAAFNPLNSTLKTSGSQVMSGGNSAGVQAYSSWQVGIAAIANTLTSYPKIMAALQTGDPWTANNSGQLGGELQTWSGNGYTQVGENTSYGQTHTSATTGGTVTQAAGAAAAPSLSMGDIPAVQAYIRNNFGTDSWLLDIPDVAKVLEQAVVNGDSSQQVQAAVQQTDWWKTTAQSVKNFEQQSANNPADYSFATKGSLASQTLAQILASAATDGVTLDPATGQQIATNALKYGWNSQQIQAAIGGTVSYNGQTGNAGSVIQQLRAVSSQYLQDPTAQVLQSWAQNVAGGTQTMDQFKAYMAQNAALKWSGMASQIQQGYTPDQIVDNLRSDAAKTMEVDPASIDFVNNPTYSKILDYVAPGDNVHRMMTQSEMDAYLKTTQQWSGTQQARDQAASLTQTIASTFGKVGG